MGHQAALIQSPAEENGRWLPTFFFFKGFPRRARPDNRASVSGPLSLSTVCAATACLDQVPCLRPAKHSRRLVNPRVSALLILIFLRRGAARCPPPLQPPFAFFAFRLDLRIRRLIVTPFGRDSTYLRRRRGAITMTRSASGLICNQCSPGPRGGRPPPSFFSLPLSAPLPSSCGGCYAAVRLRHTFRGTCVVGTGPPRASVLLRVAAVPNAGFPSPIHRVSDPSSRPTDPGCFSACSVPI